ncbi:MAG: hypothetical protein ACRDDY_04265 [Clostridium sp.]|uniref:hypothetical protein n=1 Tax=Clostridium sp. TaxID=1506 RepID=UPI003EE69FC4
MKELRVKVLLEDGSEEFKNVMVDLGIVPYVNEVKNHDKLYTIGCCSGHQYEEGHVLYDQEKSTLGWVQLHRLEPNDVNIKQLMGLISAYDHIPSYKDDVSEIVVVLDPFRGITPMDYNRVYMSQIMWDEYNSSSKEYTLIGIDEIIIVIPEKQIVVGKYINVHSTNERKARLISRQSEIGYHF